MAPMMQRIWERRREKNNPASTDASESGEARRVGLAPNIETCESDTKGTTIGDPYCGGVGDSPE
jgi:hypothetical protein